MNAVAQIEVRLFNWFDNNYSGIDPRDQMNVFKKWCRANVDPDDWRSDGVTIFSYRMYFNNPEDATLFRLVFGA